MQNHLKDKMDRGQPVFVSQLRFGLPAIAELFGLAGFDGLIIDSEHAPQTPRGVQAQLQAIGCTPATPIMRLPKVDEEQIRVHLDMGATAILTAFVNTPEEAEAGAKACRYPPKGVRGFGPARASGYGLQSGLSYMAESDEKTLYIPLIETVEAIDQIEGIMAVEGVGTCIIGPVDLSISMGAPFKFDTPAFRDAESKVVEAARKAGKPAGAAALGAMHDADFARREIDAGFRLLVVGGDEPILTDGARRLAEQLERVRSQV